tara:strand:+ start:2408 stop:3064 length:657 start_codon:yes stop_codon:yes gene_type:complete
MASKQAPPARVAKETMDLATEMLQLIEALPDGVEKDALMGHKQIAVWHYYRDECNVRLYTHRPTQEEKVAGVTVAPDGKEIPLLRKARMCPHCKCSAQEFKRHRNTAKCIRNRAKNQLFCVEIQKFDKGKLTAPAVLATAVKDETAPVVMATVVKEETAPLPLAVVVEDERPLPHHSEVPPPRPPPPPPPSYEEAQVVLIKRKKKKKIHKRLVIKGEE